LARGSGAEVPQHCGPLSLGPVAERVKRKESSEESAAGLHAQAIMTNEVSAMTLTIELPDEQTLVLKAKAQAQGVSTEQYARQVLEQDLVPAWLRESWDSAKQTATNQLSMDEIDREIAAARKARREGPSQPGS
jgi:hypothetical protein